MNEVDVDGCKTEKETRKSRRNALFAVVVTFLFVISAIQAVATVASAADDEEREFIIGMGESVISANPFTGIYDSDYLLYSYVYDYLMYPNEDGLPTPNLAQSWFYMDGSYAAAHGTDFNDTYLSGYTPSQWMEGSIWQFNLTPNVKWNDGIDFTADDVVWTLNVQSGPNFMTYWAYQPYTRWIHHAEKIDDMTVRVFFANYTSDFSGEPIPAGWVYSMSCPIMPAHMFSGKPASYMALSWDGIPTIGTGPFMGTDNLADEIINKESITLVKNPYWRYKINDTDAVATGGVGGFYNRTIEIEKIIMKFYSEEQTLILDLKAGKLDSSEVTPVNYFALQANLPENMHVVSTYSSTVYAKCSHWNANVGSAGTLNPARLDPAVWRASQLATNKTKLVDVVFKGLGDPGVGIISPVFPKWYYDVTKDTTNVSTFNVHVVNATTGNWTVNYTYTATMKDILKYDIARANAILDAAGYLWTGTVGNSVRKVGPVAAERLVKMGYAADLQGAMYDSDMNPRTLKIEDIYEIEVFEDKETAEFYAAEWKAIGIDLVPRPVDVGTWNEMVYGYQYHFTETYWSGDPDPNYLLYVPTTYAMNGWNEWGTQNGTYDHLYDQQARGMTFEDREHWVLECQKFQYTDMGMIWSCSPKTCYAYNEGPRWANFGDWEAHPGLAIDHFWGETPLFLRVKWNGTAPVDNSLMLYIGVGAGIGAVVAVAAAVVVIRKSKAKKMLEEEEEETEEKEED